MSVKKPTMLLGIVTLCAALGLQEAENTEPCKIPGSYADADLQSGMSASELCGRAEVLSHCLGVHARHQDLRYDNAGRY